MSVTTMANCRTILQVGCGTWGRLVLRDLIKLGAEVTVVARSEQSKNNARQYNPQRVVDSIEDALSRCHHYHGIVVITPLTTHFEVIHKLLTTLPSIPIFCEKELVPTVAEALELKALGGDRVFTMHKWRYHQGVLCLKELVQKLPYGQLRGIKLQRLGWGSSQKDVDTIMTAMPHDLSILYELLGYVPTTFTTIKDCHKGWTHSQVVIAPGPPFVSFEVSSRSPRNCRSVQLFFDTATAILEDSYEDKIKIYHYGALQDKTPPPPDELSFNANMPLETELEQFLRYVNGESVVLKSSIDESIVMIDALQKISRGDR